jgi:hypothetical protein
MVYIQRLTIKMGLCTVTSAIRFQRKIMASPITKARIIYQFSRGGEAKNCPEGQFSLVGSRQFAEKAITKLFN